MIALSVSMARVEFMLAAWFGGALLVLVAWRLWLRDCTHPAPPAPARSVIEDTARTVELPIVEPDALDWFDHQFAPRAELRHQAAVRARRAHPSGPT